MKFLIPQGIGDSVWALMFLQSIRDAFLQDKIKSGKSVSLDDARIDIQIACHSPNTLIERRALDFVKAFSFVDSAEMVHAGINHPQKPFTDMQGQPNYIPSGWSEAQEIFTIVPNAWLDRGKRIETVLDGRYQVNWRVMESFRLTLGDIAIVNSVRELVSSAMPRADFCVFYPGPLRGNFDEGHNRGPIWKPEDWVYLATKCNTLGIVPVFVGASYDANFYDEKLQPLLVKNKVCCVNAIGATSVAKCFAICRAARFVISYPAGIGICASLMGQRTLMWLRPYGDTISPGCFFSLNEKMIDSWIRPDLLGKTYIGLIYGRQTAEEIFEMIKERQWL